MLDVVNRNVANIVLATEGGDSIGTIAETIGPSYGWTHRWATQVAGIGVRDRDDGVVMADEEFDTAFETAAGDGPLAGHRGGRPLSVPQLHRDRLCVPEDGPGFGLDGGWVPDQPQPGPIVTRYPRSIRDSNGTLTSVSTWVSNPLFEHGQTV